MKQRIEENLKKNLKINFLEVKNNSDLHRGHLESSDGETHFALIIESEELKKIGKIQGHRKINQILKDEFAKGLHALEVKIIY